ncbi:MAG TPA: DegT/DnrJ/EryC1/StrS family aminotransferase, partial [Polyangiaceae bacterium]
CEPGQDNTCGRRFDWKLGDLPQGYDHKFTYSHLGFNLKITDMQAAVALAQLDRLEAFVAARRHNFDQLRLRFEPLSEHFILPRATPGSDPSWFGFPITIRPGSKLDRNGLQRFLDSRKIGSRLLFGGNLTRQPYLEGRTVRVASSLANTDVIAANTLWLGVFPGLTEPMLDWVVDSVTAFTREQAGKRPLPVL